MDPRGGGVCQTIRYYAMPFLEQGHDVEVVCLDDPKSEYLASDTLRIHALGRGRGAWNFHPALLPWFKANLTKYDAVVMNGLWQYQCYALWKATRRNQMPPYYIFPHGMLDPWFQKLTVRPIKSVRNWLAWKIFQHRVIRRANALLFTCEEERRLARLPFQPYWPQREAVVGLGLPQPPAYQPAMRNAFLEKCPGLEEQPYLLFLGRIHEKKGVDALIKAYAALHQSPVRSAVPKLVIAGPGRETEYGRKMLRWAEELCPAGSVYWPGMLSGDAKWGALYGCEASVLPSHQENFGISVVETLACGRPVLISDQVNIWREIEGAGAALVKPDTVAGTTDLLADWINLPAATKAAMADQARPCYQNFFSIESAAGKLMAAINSKC
jgi:glycosyltransferase involved in cell wall biosynthesis